MYICQSMGYCLANPGTAEQGGWRALVSPIIIQVRATLIWRSIYGPNNNE